jgi:hypothetical protein
VDNKNLGTLFVWDNDVSAAVAYPPAGLFYLCELSANGSLSDDQLSSAVTSLFEAAGKLEPSGSSPVSLMAPTGTQATQEDGKPVQVNRHIRSPRLTPWRRLGKLQKMRLRSLRSNKHCSSSRIIKELGAAFEGLIAHQWRVIKKGEEMHLSDEHERVRVPKPMRHLVKAWADRVEIAFD